LANDPTVNVPPDDPTNRALSLSKSRSLRELQFSAETFVTWFPPRDIRDAQDSHRDLLSSATSGTLHDIVFVYERGDFHHDNPHSWLQTEDEWYARQFEAFRALHEARQYRLVLVVKGAGGESLQEVERAVARERAKGPGLPSKIEVLHTH